MQSFLEKLVKQLYSNYGEGISELCIVLPNRRAGLFLKTHFAQHIKTTFWSPEIYATEDFVALLSELEIVDTTTLLFELYETVKNVKKNNDETFEEFSKWGQVFLNDINEIDLYLVDAKQLFGNLKDMKELDTWTLSKEETLTDFQKQYLNFWQSLGVYYFDFKNRLLSKHQAYQGLAYKVVAENLSEKTNKHYWKKIIFAGFNALNKAEENIIEDLLNAGKAEIIWDIDSYYVNDIKQEAGKFYRKYTNTGNFLKATEKPTRNSVFEENLLSTDPKKITIIGAAKNVAQAKLAGNVITELKKTNEDLQNTALVLADENLLFPVLHSLPEDLNDINVTMGYPLKNTPLSGYFDLLFNLHINAAKLGRGKTKYSYYYTDLLNLLNHPYTGILIYNTAKHLSVKSVVRTIQERNIVFASLSTLEKLFSEKPEVYKKLEPLFNHWQTPVDAITCIHYLIEELKSNIISQQHLEAKNTISLELEYLFAFTKIIKRMEALMKDYSDSILDIKTFYNTFKQIARTATLPFYGEPLMGLQVMGMLETRTLDFENVILLSCNEDILPSAKSTNTFIPFDLKYHFGLPTYGDRDSIFAYHFYRLLQRATNIYLVYNTETDALGSGEKSRFLTQLIHELPRVNPNVTVEEKILNIPVDVNFNGNEINILKTPFIIEQLMQKAVYGFSPSLLNRYINCPLQFYFQSIAGLKEADEVEETIGADTLGSVIHEVLETLYTPFIGKNIKAADIKLMKEQAEGLVKKGFEKNYSSNDTAYGKNLLIIKVSLKFIHNFLNAEVKLIEQSEKQGKPILIKQLETELEGTLTIDDKIINFHGKADRIDSIGNTIRIIDYKTGIAEAKELKLTDWDKLRNEPLFAKTFQLLMYGWMYSKTNSNLNENLVSGIISFRELSAGLKTVTIYGNDLLSPSVLQTFEEQLKIIINELFDPEIEFKQTNIIENCCYCSFKGICGRQML
jgi:CRISPR/Cas system-associated exonuclease Cas4 (RecB family)